MRSFFPTVLVVMVASGCLSMQDIWADTKNSARSQPASHKRVQRTAGKARAAQESGDFAAAERLYSRLRSMKPEEPRLAESHAAALARLGRKDEAYGALEAGVALGLTALASFETDPELEGWREETRFREIEQRVRSNHDAFKQQIRAAHRPLASSQAPAFASWAALEQALGREREQHERYPAWPSVQAWLLEKIRLDQRYLAAMRRYADDHPDAADREDAMLGELRLRVEVASPWTPYWSIDQAAAVRESADRYLVAFADAAARNEARLYRAVAAMRGVLDPAEELDWESGDPPQPKCDDARVELDELARQAPSDKWAADALGFAALCAAQQEPRNEPEARARVDAYLALAELPRPDQTPFHGLRGEVRVEKMRLDGLPAFEVIDIKGARWTPSTLKGRVALIDFWAPG